MLSKVKLFSKKNNKYIEHIIEQRESTEACEIKMLPEVKIHLENIGGTESFTKRNIKKIKTA